MKIFNIFSVTPIDVKSHEMPAVCIHQFYVAADSLAAAFESIKEFTHVATASEVYGAELQIELRAGLVVGPDTLLTQRVALAQHRHWASVQGRYVLLARGAESPETFFQRLFVERNPQFA